MANLIRKSYQKTFKEELAVKLENNVKKLHINGTISNPTDTTECIFSIKNVKVVIVANMDHVNVRVDDSALSHVVRSELRTFLRAHKFGFLGSNAKINASYLQKVCKTPLRTTSIAKAVDETMAILDSGDNLADYIYQLV